MEATHEDYILALRKELTSRADPEKAFYMKKYMLGQYEYFGLAAPERRDLQKEFVLRHGYPGQEGLPQLVRMLWDQPEREFQYFAMEMMAKFCKRVPGDMIRTYELMILGKSWWDTVDFIAAVLVGEHFRRFPEMVVPYTGKWMASGNMWLRRTALLFQLKYKKHTDFDLLASFIIPLAGSREFFIRKAIGWALREYSKTDPQRVQAFVTATPLAPLSRKEALRRIR